MSNTTSLHPSSPSCSTQEKSEVLQRRLLSSAKNPYAINLWAKIYVKRPWHAPSPMRTAHSVLRLVFILSSLAQDALRFFLLGTRSGAAIKAENMFLRKQLALYLEREVKRRRATDATRLSLVLLSRLFAWQDALVNVKPVTFLSWHRKGFQLLWRWKLRPRGMPRVPGRLQELIFKMAHDNPTWGEERIAAELLLNLGIRVSPRTVRRYMPLNTGPRKRLPSQPWMTFVRNHAQAMLASDFFVVVTARFRVLYVFVIMEVGTCKIAHCNVTDHPTAAWTIQQFREVITGEHPYLVRSPRPGQHLLDGTRLRPEVAGRHFLEDPVSGAASKFFL